MASTEEPHAAPRTPPASSEATRHSMQGNRSRDTKPELIVRRCLREAGLTGYRLQWKKAPGRPDVAFVGRRVAVFVNGCFWHRCPYCRPSRPRTNVEFWDAKFARNQARDAANVAELVGLGWTVIVVWECRLKKKRLKRTMAEVVAQVRHGLAAGERTPGMPATDEASVVSAKDAGSRGERVGRLVVIGHVGIRGPRGLAAQRVAFRSHEVRHIRRDHIHPSRV